MANRIQQLDSTSDYAKYMVVDESAVSFQCQKNSVVSKLGFAEATDKDMPPAKLVYVTLAHDDGDLTLTGMVLCEMLPDGAELKERLSNLSSGPFDVTLIKAFVNEGTDEQVAAAYKLFRQKEAELIAKHIKTIPLFSHFDELDLNLSVPDACVRLEQMKNDPKHAWLRLFSFKNQG